MSFAKIWFGRSFVCFSSGLVVTANLGMFPSPGFAQQRTELEKVCRDVVLGTVYAARPPSSFKVSLEGKFGAGLYFDKSTDENVKFVTSYSADFVTTSQTASQTATQTVSLQGACGFDTSENLIAIRINRRNIWRNPTEFQDYGKLNDLGRVIAFRKGIQTSSTNPAVRTFAAMVNDRQEVWAANCRTRQVERAKQPMKPNSFTTSLNKYICNEESPTPSSKTLDVSVSQQMTRIVESNGTTVILPASYDKQKSYPAVVLLPFTGGTGLRFFEWAYEKPYQDRQTNPFIVILPTGKGSVSDYTPGSAFERTIQRYDNQVKSDLKALIPKYKIDASRVSIGGYSLGADLGWALSLRNPELFRGAILIDSICSDRRSSSMNQLAKRNFRVFMIVGQKEAGEQNHPMHEIRKLLAQYKISNEYKDFSKSDHNTILNDISPAMFMQAVDYSLAIQ
jgi:predicted esterase